MGGDLKVWRQHLNSEGVARNNVVPVEKTMELDSQVNGLRQKLRVTDPEHAPNPTPDCPVRYKFGSLMRSPWTSSHSIPSRYGLEELQSPWEASGSKAPISQSHTSGQKPEESLGCGALLRLEEELYNIHMGRLWWNIYQREPEPARGVQL